MTALFPDRKGAATENRIDAIYARQSVDRKDSISSESQIELCKYELRGGNFRQYTDKGYSGKNTDRPKIQELMADIKRGLIKRVVVYKLDRISRSILDFATMMETFQAYNVEFVSSTEKFDTSTPMGRAMLNICIVFAQLERETIQKRVTDAYYSRCQRGFHMSGAAPFGFQLEPTTIQGIRTKMMIPDPDTANITRLMFEMYAEPSTSFGILPGTSPRRAYWCMKRFIYGEMVKKLAQFQTLTGKREKVNPRLTALNVELAHVEDEIEKLLNTLTGASAVLMSYANTKIEELDAQRQMLSREIATLSAETMSPEQIERLSVYLNRWEEIDFDDRRQVADGLISQIRATGECVAIEWKSDFQRSIALDYGLYALVKRCKRNCRYHIVAASKYRRKVLFREKNGSRKDFAAAM